jgi:hypothetical protein
MVWWQASAFAVLVALIVLTVYDVSSLGSSRRKHQD